MNPRFLLFPKSVKEYSNSISEDDIFFSYFVSGKSGNTLNSKFAILNTNYHDE